VGERCAQPRLPGLALSGAHAPGQRPANLLGGVQRKAQGMAGRLEVPGPPAGRQLANIASRRLAMDLQELSLPHRYFASSRETGPVLFSCEAAKNAKPATIALQSAYEELMINVEPGELHSARAGSHARPGRARTRIQG